MEEMKVEGTQGRDDLGPVTGAVLLQDVFRHYKSLIGQIEIALPRQQTRTLLLSSSVQMEGTTEVTVGLALTLALEMGKKTAIIDANTNHPDLNRRFGTPDSGLGEYLKGSLTIERALVNTTVPNLHIMPLGKSVPSLGTFGREPLEAMVSQLRNRFDYVLIDTAPIGMNPESTILVDTVDAVILVVRHGSTRREVVRKTKDVIERAGGKILGVVLNKRTFPIPEFLYRRL
jgi:capsular exopolysaccharide synthesis family protein